MIPVHVTYQISPLGSKQTAIVWVSETSADDIMDALIESIATPYMNEYPSRGRDMDCRGLSPYIWHIVFTLRPYVLGLRPVYSSDSFDI